MCSFRFGLSAEQVMWVEDQLSNNEVPSDEMQECFVTRGMTDEQAD